MVPKKQIATKAMPTTFNGNHTLAVVATTKVINNLAWGTSVPRRNTVAQSTRTIKTNCKDRCPYEVTTELAMPTTNMATQTSGAGAIRAATPRTLGQSGTTRSANGANAIGTRAIRKNWVPMTVFTATATSFTPPSNSIDSTEMSAAIVTMTKINGPPA